MKKILSFILVFAIVFSSVSMVSISANAQTLTTETVATITDKAVVNGDAENGNTGWDVFLAVLRP